MATYGVSTNPIFMPGNVEPRYSTYLSFIGISVDHVTDTNRYLDATLAYQDACHNAVDYLMRFGYTGPQAYLLLGSAPIEGRTQRRRGHPQRLLLALPADGDLRLRRHPVGVRPDLRRPRRGGRVVLSWRPLRAAFTR